jgi:hypothetical protein
MKINALIVSMVLSVSPMIAQQAGAAKDTNPPAAKKEQAKQTPRAWRFEYTLIEINGKQRTNVRKFDVLTSSRAEVHSSSRVPIPVGAVTGNGNTQFTYTEVGLTASMQCFPHPEGEIDLQVEVSMTFVVNPETPSSNLPPITRQIRMKVDTQIKAGVPTVLETVDDVASTHSYELSVTATPH